MMTPFAPHFCEEMWERLGREPFVVTEKWPELEINESGPAAELAERLLRNTIEDVKKIISATSASYTTLNLYTAEDWKRTTFKGLAWAAMEGSSVSEAISSAMKDPEVRSHGKAAASYIKEVFTDLSRRPEQELRLLAETEIDEYEVLKGASDFVGSETQMEVHVQRADEPERDPSKKAPRAMPMRPAIYLE